MEFFNEAINVLQTLVIALGAGLGVWGVINLLEGYGNDNPGAKSQGMKQLMAGAGVAVVGLILVPLLSGLLPSKLSLKNPCPSRNNREGLKGGHTVWIFCWTRLLSGSRKCW